MSSSVQTFYHDINWRNNMAKRLNKYIRQRTITVVYIRIKEYIYRGFNLPFGYKYLI